MRFYTNSRSHYTRKKPSIIRKRLIFMLVVLLGGYLLMNMTQQVYWQHHHHGSVQPMPSITPLLNTTRQNLVQADFVFVKKSARLMFLLKDKKIIKQYHIALGDSPQGHKQQEGDEKTPEGLYTLDYKKEDSIAYRSIHISYPNKTDIANAKKHGVSPGGFIMIHGQMNGYDYLTDIMQQRDWTDGCIAVTNAEMDDIMARVPVGTPIQIVW